MADPPPITIGTPAPVQIPTPPTQRTVPTQPTGRPRISPQTAEFFNQGFNLPISPNYFQPGVDFQPRPDTADVLMPGQSRPPEPSFLEKLTGWGGLGDTQLDAGTGSLAFTDFNMASATSPIAGLGYTWEAGKPVAEATTANVVMPALAFVGDRTKGLSEEIKAWEQLEGIPTWALGTQMPGAMDAGIRSDLVDFAGRENVKQFQALAEEGEKIHNMSPSDARTYAYRQTDFEPGFKGMMEEIFHPMGLPLELIPGIGIFAGMTRGSAQALLRGTRRIADIPGAPQFDFLFPSPTEFGRKLNRADIIPPLPTVDVPQIQTIDGIPSIVPEGNVQTIGQSFPGGAPYRQSEEAFKQAAIDVENARVQFQYDPVTLVRRNIEPWDLRPSSEGFRKGDRRWTEPSGILVERGTTPHGGSISARTSTPPPIGSPTATGEPGWGQAGRVEPPILAGNRVTEWKLPPLIQNLERAAFQGRRLVLSDTQVNRLRDFFGQYGVDPWNSSDEALGRFEISPADGSRQFIVGAFDNPYRTNPAGVSVSGDMPFERSYVTYNPETKSFGIQAALGEKPKMVNPGTGRNVTDEMEKINRQAEDTILRIEAEMAVEPILSPRYKQLTGQLNAVNEQRLHALSRLKQEPVVPVPEPPPSLTPTAEEVDSYIKMWERLHMDEVFNPVIKKKEWVPRGRVKSKIPTEPWGMPIPSNSNVAYRAVPGVPGYPGSEWQYGGHFRPVHPDERMVDRVFMREMNNPNNHTVFHAWHETVKKIAKQKNLPEPSVPHGTASSTAGEPTDSVGALDKLLNARGEGDWKNSVAKWFGFRQVATNDLRNWIDDGNAILRKIGIGKRYRGQHILTREEGIAIMRHLNDGAPLPEGEGWAEFAEHITTLRKQEQTEYIQFNPDLKDIFNGHPNYFPRNWIAPESIRDIWARGQNHAGIMNSKVPSHLRLRNDATFEEMLDKGWEPVSWNPIDMMAIRRMEGIAHRETILLRQHMIKNGTAISSEDFWALASENAELLKQWRVPKVGSIFEGTLAESAKDGKSIHKGEYYVPNASATMMESVWGTPLKSPMTLPIKKDVVLLGKTIIPKEIDLIQTVATFGSTLKRSILAASGFQHVDMFFRAGATSVGSPLNLLKYHYWRRGGLLKMLPLTGRILASSFYSGAFKGLGRRATRNRSLDPTPILKWTDESGVEQSINFRMIGEEGWNTNGDPSIMRREVVKNLEDIRRSIEQKKGIPNLVFNRLKGAVQFWESGLFDGVYRETQMFMLENFILPQMRKKYPHETARQISARAAEKVNILTSSLGDWQTVIQNKHVKELSRALIFSTNETEAWLKASLGTVKGDARRLYTQYWAGYFTFLAIIANAINLAGPEHSLMKDPSSYVPIRTKTEWEKENGSFDLIPTYNTRFMAPVIGYGRNGQPIYLDIVGQADTPFRWAFDPGQAIVSRVSPMASMVRPFWTGQTFFGEPLESFPEKVAYSIGQNMPIGLWQTGQMLREDSEFLQNYLPEAESGIGTQGGLFQIGGFNVRAMTRKELMDELAEREGFDKAPTEWLKWGTYMGETPSPYDVMREDISSRNIQIALSKPHNQDLKRELDMRLETGYEREQEYAEYLTGIGKSWEDYRIKQDNLVNRVRNGEYLSNGRLTWYEQHQDNTLVFWAERATGDKIFNRYEKRDRPPDSRPNEVARYEFYGAMDKARRLDGSFDYDIFDVEITNLKTNTWTNSQRAHIESQIETKDYSLYNPWIADILRTRDKYSWYFELKPRYFANRGMTDQFEAYKTSLIPRDYLKSNPTFAKELKGLEEKIKETRESDLVLLENLMMLGFVPVSTYKRVLGEQQNNQR